MRENIKRQLADIVSLLDDQPEGLSLSGIAKKLDYSGSSRTLQRRLAELVSQRIVVRTGDKKSTKYFLSVDYESRQVSDDIRHNNGGKRQVSDDVRHNNDDKQQVSDDIRHNNGDKRQVSDDIRQNNGDKRQISDDIRHNIDDKRQVSDDIRQEQVFADMNFSKESKKLLRFLEIPPYARNPVSYKREFIESYIPNETTYVHEDLRKELSGKGRRFNKELAVGTYAKQILQRLLIDLSYNSSRLEGNTYSKLETKKLLEGGKVPEGKSPEETTMILNHMEAIRFLVENADAILVDSFTLFNIHSLLSQDLLLNPNARGQIRDIEIEISNSRYIPLSNTYILQELFDILLLKANAITNPFEQSFFLLVHVAYLQAFEDVNKRTSRLSCNIPFIKCNLCPVSFINVSRKDYTAALLAIYERNEVIPMLEVFRWAYLQSCNQYSAVKDSISDFDFYRVRYRTLRKEVLGDIVRGELHGRDIDGYVQKITSENGIENPEKFLRIVREDAEYLHEGAIVGLNISIDQFRNWVRHRV